MDLLVAYDVATDTPEGRKRLRNVAQVCKNYGQRVQKSVFECSVTEVQFERFRHQVLKQIDAREDNLRIYHFPEGYREKVEYYGIGRVVDFEGPLVV